MCATKTVKDMRSAAGGRNKKEFRILQCRATCVTWKVTVTTWRGNEAKNDRQPRATPITIKEAYALASEGRAIV